MLGVGNVEEQNGNDNLASMCRHAPLHQEDVSPIGELALSWAKYYLSKVRKILSSLTQRGDRVRTDAGCPQLVNRAREG
jgi:hypothetical protein